MFMNKIYLLSKALNDIGLHKESGYIDSLIKVSNLSGIKTLGLKDSAAKTFVESFGEKWAFVIAKWVIESSVGNKSFENYYEVFFTENAATLCKALNACDQLLKTPVDKREIKFNKKGDYDFLNLKSYMYERRLKISNLWEAQILDDFFKRMYKRDNIHPDEFIISLISELKDKLKSKIEYFKDEDIINSLIQNKFLSVREAKELSFEDAVKIFLKKKETDMPIILSMDDGWKWVDAGGGKSQWVRENLKNCGSSQWGNLRAAKESAKEAKMLILLDGNNKAHGITTWNPKYAEREDDYIAGRTDNYLGHIEGVGSNPLNPTYYKYFLELANHIKPTKIYVRNMSMLDTGGNRADNDDLKKALIGYNLSD